MNHILEKKFVLNKKRKIMTASQIAKQHGITTEEAKELLAGLIRTKQARFSKRGGVILHE